MGQSLVKNYVHLVFSTKYRQPFIQPFVEEELHKYIAGICDACESPAVKIGGYTDHVHVLCRLSKNIMLVKLVEEIKSHSSKWMKTKHTALHNFYWQRGYGAFSVTPSQIANTIAYIEGQHEHHNQIVFQDEYRSFLKEYEVEYDEQFVWD